MSRIPTDRVVAGVLLGAALATGLPAGAAESPPPESRGRMILVLDSSGSMAEPAGGGQTKIQAARTALERVVEGLPEEAEVGLRVFGAQVFSRGDAGACEDTQLVVEPGSDNRAELRAAIADYEPYGETPVPHALRSAASDLGGEGPRSIVLVSDGESTCDPDPCLVAAELAEQGIDLRIDVVGLSVTGRAQQQLQCIAERGNGSYYDAADAADIEAKLTHVAQRAARPFALAGTPIEGGTADSPAPISVGDWTDRLGPVGSEKYYLFTRTQAGTTLRVSAITQGPGGDEGLQLEITGPDGHDCDVANTIRQIDTRRVVSVQVSALPEVDCAAPGDYLIRVERRLAPRGETPIGLRVTEEPVIDDPGTTADGSVEVVPPSVTGRPAYVPGGQSFTDAGDLDTGRWRSSVVPGEASMYRFPLDYGQSARISVDFPKPGAAARALVDRSTLAQIVLYNPMQGQLSAPPGAVFSAPVGVEPQTLVTGTPAVSRSLVDGGGINGVEDYSTAGDYYLGVSLMRADHSVELPFTLDLEILGDPAPGPQYADGATWSVADGTVLPDDSADADPTADAADDTTTEGTDAGSLPAGLTIGVALIALGAVAAGVLLWRRSRV